MTASLYNPRLYHTQQVHYLRKNFTYADSLATLDVGVIPAGSVVLKPISGVSVHVAFTAGTNKRLDIGPSTDTGTNLWGTLLSLASINALVPLDEAVTMKVDVDTLVQAYVDCTGATNTAGEGVIVIAYVPNNDR